MPQQLTASASRGSALIVAIIFTAVLALAIPSYLTLSGTTLRASHNAFYRNAAFNLAESGIEHALWTLHLDEAGADPWGTWTFSGNNAHTRISGFQFDNGVTGSIDIYLSDLNGADFEVVAQGHIHSPLGGTSSVQRMMQADLTESGGRGLFAYGMLARDYIEASGGVAFDSWISNPDGDPTAPYVPYHRDIARDKIAIATTSTREGAISLGSSDVYGTAAVGASTEFGVHVGWGGQVGPRIESDWDPEDRADLWMKDGRMISHATGALTTNFTATFEEITVPENLLPIFREAYTLPYTYRKPVQHWFENTYVDKETLGIRGMETVIQMPSLMVRAGATLTIAGDVTLILPNENVNSLQVIEGGRIQLETDATLRIYTAGNTIISGAGLFNQVAPSQLQLWGTAQEQQQITFQGSGSLSGVIYAPNAHITLPGGTNIYGAIVANTVRMQGSGSVHYDESLRDFAGSGGTGGSVAVSHIRELATAEERNRYSSLINRF